MQKAGEIGARRHFDAGEWLFKRAGAADAGTAFEDEHAFSGSSEIGGTRETVVTRADDDGIPGARGEMGDRLWQTDLAEDGDGGRSYLYAGWVLHSLRLFRMSLRIIAIISTYVARDCALA
jgi:hypothetical protein